METKIKATARVHITLEIDTDDVWGEDCSIGQLNKQATYSAINILNNLLSVKEGCIQRIRVIGEPKVIGILTEEK